MVSRGIAGTRMTTCRSRVVQALRGDAVAASEISLPLLLSRMYTDRVERISTQLFAVSARACYTSVRHSAFTRYSRAQLPSRAQSGVSWRRMHREGRDLRA